MNGSTTTFTAATEDMDLLGVVDGRIALSHRRSDLIQVRDTTVTQPTDSGTLRAGRETGSAAVDSTVTVELRNAVTGDVEGTHVVDLAQHDQHFPRLGDRDGDGSPDLLIDVRGLSDDTWDCVRVDLLRECTDPRSVF